MSALPSGINIAAVALAETLAAVGERMRREHADVATGKIFHSAGLNAGGRFFAFTRREELVVKLAARRVEELVATGEGRPFEAGRGRPMREWVVLRPADERGCEAYAREAHAFVSAL